MWLRVVIRKRYIGKILTVRPWQRSNAFAINLGWFEPQKAKNLEITDSNERQKKDLNGPKKKKKKVLKIQLALKVSKTMRRKKKIMEYKWELSISETMPIIRHGGINPTN